MRDNERAAQSFGVTLVRTRLATFAISGFLAGLRRRALAHQQHAVQPEQFGAEQSIQMFLMAVIGGLGSVTGVLIGAIYLGTVDVLSSKGVLGQLLASGGGRARGPALLSGRARRPDVLAVRDAWLRRIALREKIFVRSLLGDVRDLDERARPGATRGRSPSTERRRTRSTPTIRAAGASPAREGVGVRMSDTAVSRSRTVTGGASPLPLLVLFGLNAVDELDQRRVRGAAARDPRLVRRVAHHRAHAQSVADAAHASSSPCRSGSSPTGSTASG